MKLQRAFSILLALGLSGCLHLKTESQSSFYMSPQQEIEVNGICSDMLLDGNILSLLQNIKTTTDHVLNLIESDPTHNRDKISKLANEITSDTEKVKSLSRPEWTETKYDHVLGWLIDDRDFNDSAETHLNQFKLIGAELINIYFMGQIRNDLKSKLLLNFDPSGIQIQFRNKTSAMDLCQLEKTLMIVVKVKSKRLFSKNSRYFNLIVTR